MRHSVRSVLHASIAATMAMPSASVNTGKVMATFRVPQDSVTSPACSATHAAPAAASAINNRNRMIRYIEILLRRFGEHSHRLSREFPGCGDGGIARIGLVDPRLRGGAIGG